MLLLIFITIVINLQFVLSTTGFENYSLDSSDLITFNESENPNFALEIQDQNFEDHLEAILSQEMRKNFQENETFRNETMMEIIKNYLRNSSVKKTAKQSIHPCDIGFKDGYFVSVDFF